MGKEVAINKSNPLANFAEGVDPFSSFGNEAGSYSIYVSFNGNDGDWTKGKHKEIIDDDTLVVVNMMSMARGWICWKDGVVMGEPMDEIMLNKPALRESELDPHGPYTDKDDGWSEQSAVTMAFMTDGGNLEYKSTSKSGIRALQGLAKEFGEKMRMHIDDVGEPMMPVCELSNESFMVRDKESDNPNKKFKKYAPVFTIVDWISFSEMTSLLEITEERTEGETVQKALADAGGGAVDDDDDDDEPKKKKKKKKNKGDRKSRY